VGSDAKLAVDPGVEFEAVTLDQIMTALEGAEKLKLIPQIPAATIVRAADALHRGPEVALID
jgi:hypothetical protein